jgi:hypothetical protein
MARLTWFPKLLFLVVLGGLIFLMTLTADKAWGHDAEELDAWVLAWVTEADTSLTPQMQADWTDMATRHPYYFNPQPEPTYRASEPTSRGMGGDVEQWRPLVLAYFGSERVNTALCIMKHESGGNPNAQNPHSSAAGLFQIMGFWWDKYGGNRYDPETNVALARKIYDQQGWNAWNPYKRGLCR